jgi:hypothetical protein
MQGEHVVVLTSQYFIAGLDDQVVPLVVEALAAVVCDRGLFSTSRRP